MGGCTDHWAGARPMDAFPVCRRNGTLTNTAIQRGAGHVKESAEAIAQDHASSPNSKEPKRSLQVTQALKCSIVCVLHLKYVSRGTSKNTGFQCVKKVPILN